MSKIKTAATQRREKLRQQYWHDEEAWTAEKELGWFRAPRTLPLVLSLLSSKELSGRKDPSRVYLELLARHVDEGVVEMVTEAEHAYSAGYEGSRAVRTWLERMKILEKTGFIKAKPIGSQRYKYVLLVHPTLAIQRLYEDEKIPERWWDAYRARQIETKEASYEERQKAKGPLNVVPLQPRKPATLSGAKRKRKIN